MSGECDKCGEHALECGCEPLCRREESGREMIRELLEKKEKKSKLSNISKDNLKNHTEVKLDMVDKQV